MNGRTSILMPVAGRTKSDSHSTPTDLLRALHAEFRFTLDPCPLDEDPLAGLGLFRPDGLLLSWTGERVFCNPPYSNIYPWLVKASEAELAVYLVPARTDTEWWHRYAMRAREIRFIRGRLRFGLAASSAPFPSVVLVFRNEDAIPDLPIPEREDL